MKQLLLALVVCPLLCAQSTTSSNDPLYCSTSGDLTLTGTATTFTIQVPSTAKRAAYLMSAIVTTDAAATFTQATNGTAATSTAAPVTQTPSSIPTTPSQATAFVNSNVGAGTAMGGKLTTPGGTGTVVDLTNSGNYVVIKPGAASNYSITIPAYSGTANITVCWKEK